MATGKGSGGGGGKRPAKAYPRVQAYVSAAEEAEIGALHKEALAAGRTDAPKVGRWVGTWVVEAAREVARRGKPGGGIAGDPETETGLARAVELLRPLRMTREQVLAIAVDEFVQHLEDKGLDYLKAIGKPTRKAAR